MPERRDPDDWFEDDRPRRPRRDQWDDEGRGYGDERDDYDDEPVRANPRLKVRGPGTALAVVGWAGLALSLVGLAAAIIIPLSVPPPPGAPPEEQYILGAVYAVLALVSAAGFVVIALGGMRMRECRSHGLAMAAAIVAIASIACFGLCSAAIVPFGIWAVIVLSQADVRREFDRTARRGW